jgi:hypothetical protein
VSLAAQIAAAITGVEDGEFYFNFSEKPPMRVNRQSITRQDFLHNL